MKIGIISDLHGNYEALQSLPEHFDELWVLGDLVNYGPEPGAVIEFVKSNSTIIVRGNHDHSIGYDVDPRCTTRFQKIADITRRYTGSVLDKKQKDFLRALPLKLELKRRESSFYLCHAKPSDPLSVIVMSNRKSGFTNWTTLRRRCCLSATPIRRSFAGLAIAYL
jgi:predicted phosphodiesterase